MEMVNAKSMTTDEYQNLPAGAIIRSWKRFYLVQEVPSPYYLTADWVPAQPTMRPGINLRLLRTKNYYSTLMWRENQHQVAWITPSQCWRIA